IHRFVFSRLHLPPTTPFHSRNSPIEFQPPPPPTPLVLSDKMTITIVATSIIVSSSVTEETFIKNSHGLIWFESFGRRSTVVHLCLQRIILKISFDKMPEDDHSEVLKAQRISRFRRCKLQRLRASVVDKSEDDKPLD
ncbi:hypothetical protein L195_g039536, partial [Trifolium pratense]